MSALQSGHLSPRWCTVSAQDSQKRRCPQGTELYEDLYGWSDTLRSSRRMPLLWVQTLLHCSILRRCLTWPSRSTYLYDLEGHVSDRSFVPHPRLRCRRRHRSLLEDGRSTLRCGRPCYDSWRPRTVSVYCIRAAVIVIDAHRLDARVVCFRATDTKASACPDVWCLLDCPWSLVGDGPERLWDSDAQPSSVVLDCMESETLHINVICTNGVLS